MFVLDLTYLVPLSEVDAALDAHVAWLKARYAAGDFVASGRKVPRDGGIILARLPDRAAAEQIAASDPFSARGIARYRIMEFVPTMTAEEFTA